MAQSEPRKLIKFGNSSYIISLPKDWVKKNNLKKGDLVYISDHQGDILINVRDKKIESPKTSVTITLEKKDLDEIKREVTSAYINNYNEIIFSGLSKGERAEIIDKTIKDQIGVEIVEQTATQTTVKDILDLRAVSFDKITRRLDNVIRSMFEDLTIMMKTGTNKNAVKDICAADIEVNKLYFLIWKIVRKCQEEQNTAEELKISPKDMSNMQWFSLHMEYIGDSLKRIAQNLSSEKSDKKCESRILEVVETFERDYLNTLNAHYTNDKNTARKISGLKKNHQKICTSLVESCPETGAITEKLRQIASSIHNISKIMAY